MKKMKRLLSLLIVFSLLAGLGSYFPKPAFAMSSDIYTTYKASVEAQYSEAERLAFKEKIDDLSKYKGRNESIADTLYYASAILEPVEISIEQILYYLIEYKKNQVVNDDGKWLNPYIYQKYKIVAYDDLEIIEKEQRGHGSFERVDALGTKELEYRYLGYSDADIEITNDFYPADFKSGTDPLTRTYKSDSEATASWTAFNSYDYRYGQIYQMMNTKLLNDDDTEGKYELRHYTAFDLLGLSGFPGYGTFSVIGNPNVQTAQSKMIAMHFPSLATYGQFKLVHGTNRTFYDTFRTGDMTLKADVTIYPDESVYFIAPNQEEVVIDYEVRTIIDDAKTSLPYSNGVNISSVNIKSEDQETTVFSNPDLENKDLSRVLTTTFSKTVKVSDLDLSDGKDTVALEAISEYTDMADYVVSFKGSQSVSINASSDFMADFTIHDAEGDNVTDAHISVADLTFKTPEHVTLNDASATAKGNIISRTWSVLKNGEYVPISSTNETSFVFTVNEVNRVSVLNSSRLSFKLDVKTDLSEDIETAIHEVSFRKSAPPQPVPAGPVAIIAAKLDQNSNDDYKAMEGQVFDIHGRDSYHPEGIKLTKFQFNTKGGYTSSTGSKKNDYIYYLESGKYYPNMTVTDANGATDTDSTTIIVKPAEFLPIITVDGSLKENRKVSISVDNKYSLRYFPIDEQSLDWTITPLDGQGDVIRVDGSADGSKAFDLIFKDKGRYQISVTGNISSGFKSYSASASTLINIAEDIPPVADFKVSRQHVRDISHDNMTEIKIYDNSYSPDNDIIVQRKYWYRYDDDNDGDFGDTDWILLSAANYDTMSLFGDQVGKYQFKVEVKEKFGQATISKFIVDADYRRGDTDNKADDEKQTEIINIAPTVTLEIANKKPVNLIVYHDYDAAALTDFKNRLEILKAKMQGKQIDLKVEYLEPTEVVGDREAYTTYFDSYVDIDMSVEGERYHYTWSNGGNSYDVAESQRFRLYLDSFSSDGKESELYNSNKGRFELIDVSWGDSGYKKYNYKDRSYDYTEFYYRQMFINYKDRGVTKKATYNFVYKWKNYSKYDGDKKQDSFEYTDYDIISSKLHVDEPFIKRPSYIELNSAFGYGMSATPTLVKATETKKDIQIKLYKQSQMESMIGDCENEDTFFLNLCENEENRLALNKTLLEALKNHNINYLTLSKDVISINPLGGRFDKLILGAYHSIDYNRRAERYDNTVRRLFVKLGNILYELDQENKRYNLIGLAERCEEKYNDINVDIIEAPNSSSIYTTGYKGYYGTAAIDRYRQDNYTDDVDCDDQYEDYYDADDVGGVNDFVNNYFLDAFYNAHCGNLALMPDGNLVGERLYMGYYPEREFTRKSVVYGTGFVGVLKDIKLSYKSNNPYYMYPYRYARGFIQKNGNIYFKEGNGKYYYGFTNRLVITEGIENIRLIKHIEKTNSIYVYTDTSLVKYDTETGVRQLITDQVLERNGTSVRIGDNKWMVGENVYESVKEIYTTDLDGEDYQLKIYIDADGNFYKELGTTKTLVASNVNSLPLMGMMESLVNMGNSDKLKYCMSYLGEDGYLYSIDKGQLFESPVKNIEPIGDARGYNRSGWSITYYTALVHLENGRLGIQSSLNPNWLKTLKYANLTVGSIGDVVGDNQLIAVSPLSQAYEGLEQLIDGIYNAYENYSSTNSVYVVVGDTIETTMTYDDYESDEAYSMVYDFEHVDPNYFENSLGKDPAAGTGLLKPLTSLNYVGRYEVRPKVKDNPKNDDQFDNYRLANEDEALVNVYVHRRPIAQMTYRFGENTAEPEYFTFTALDNGSYDLDHLSEANKGIVEWQFSIKAEDESQWTTVNSKTFTHLKIRKGIEYTTMLRVKDQEKTWSLPLVKNFKLEEVPINIEAKLKARDEGFSTDALPITEFFNVYDISTEYHNELRLEIALYDGDERKGNLITVPFAEGSSATTDSNNPNLVHWNPKDLQVPDTLADKSYKLIVTAIDVANPSKTEKVEFDVGVRTPISPFPTMPQVFTANEDIELLCRTSKYTDSLDVTLFTGTVLESTEAMIFDRQEGQYKYWKLNYTVPEGLDDGSYQAQFTGTVNTIPVKTESVIRNFEYITLKIISAVMFPEDPMAGDKLTWIIESMGGVDKYEIIFDQDIMDNDERSSMGYDAVEYPYYIEVDEDENRKTDQLEYILWCTTPQSKTLKGNRNRGQYTFTIRAWKSSSFVDVSFEKEIIGDVRELMKVGH